MEHYRCQKCHQPFAQKSHLTRHVTKNVHNQGGRCLFDHEIHPSDLNIQTESSDNVDIINRQQTVYDKIELCKRLRSSCTTVFPMIFTPTNYRNKSNPTLKYISEIGAVNAYGTLQEAIQVSPTGFVSLPKHVTVTCKHCPQQLVLSGVTKPYRNYCIRTPN